MKISFFTPQGSDVGISHYSVKLLEAINQLNPVNIEIKVVPLKENFLIKFNPFRYFKARAMYSRLGEEMNKADIAHIQHEYSLFCLWTNPLENMYKFFRRKIKIPTVITVHEIETRKESKSKLKNILKGIYFKIFSKYIAYVFGGMFEECDGVIVHTKAAQRILIQRGVEESKIHIILHGIDIPQKSNNSIEEDKKKFGIKENQFVLMTFGLISERKGQDIVLEILDQLPQNVIYVIGGKFLEDKGYKEHLYKQIYDYHLEDRVVITGFVKDENVKYLMNATDIIVSPTRQITASGSVSDAIAYNKTILSSDLDFIKEVNEEIDCIETFKNSDSKNLLNVLKSLMNNPDRMKKLSSNTYIYQEKNCYLNSAKKTIEVYNKIIK